MKIVHRLVTVFIVAAMMALFPHLVMAAVTSPTGAWLEIIPSTSLLSISDTLTVTVVQHYDGQGCRFAYVELGLYQRSTITPSLEFISPSVLYPGDIDITNTFILRAAYTGTSQLFASAFGEYGGTPDCPWNWGYLNSAPITVTVSGIVHRQYLPVIAKQM